MRRSIVVWIAGLALVGLRASLATAAASSDLAADIRPILDDKLLTKAQVGVEIARLGSSATDADVLFEHNPTAKLAPASNLKVITTSAALDRLGSDFKFRTLLLRHGQDLVLVGDGDPALGDAEALRPVGWDVTTVFKTWAAGLVRQGLNHFANLRVDDSVFDEQFVHPHWPLDQLHKRYEAGVGGLNLNANCVDFLVRTTAPHQLVQYTMDPPTQFVTVENTCVSGDNNAIWLSREPGTNQIILRGQTPQSTDVPVSVTIQDPSMFTGAVLGETLRSGGVTFTGSVLRDRTARSAYAQWTAAGGSGGEWTLLAINETPIDTVISRANKDSMNLYAECLCKRLGFAETGRGTWADGTAAVGTFVHGLGIDSAELGLDDGCGLSHQNGISARLMVRVLAHDFVAPYSKVFLSSLSVSGSDGTLKERFQNSYLRGRVIGKSGSINGVSCLCGFLHGSDDRWYAFSIMFNGIPEGTGIGAKLLEEKIIKAVDVDCAGGRPGRR